MSKQEYIQWYLKSKQPPIRLESEGCKSIKVYVYERSLTSSIIFTNRRRIRLEEKVILSSTHSLPRSDVGGLHSAPLVYLVVAEYPPEDPVGDRAKASQGRLRLLQVCPITVYALGTVRFLKLSTRWTER